MSEQEVVALCELAMVGLAAMMSGWALYLIGKSFGRIYRQWRHGSDA